MTFETSGAVQTIAQILGSTLRVSTPLIFAAMGGLLSERSGVIQIALEGMMLIGAFAAAAVAGLAHSPWCGALAALVAGALVATVYAQFVISWRANQIVAGTAINLLAAGLTPSLCKNFFDSSSATPSLEIGERFQYAPMVFVWCFVGLFVFWIQRTPSGLWLRFAGENPLALESAGVRVNRVRWFAVIGSGVFAGLGGASLSIFLASSFSRNMTAGRGFMALAALIFGKWQPLAAAGACLLFGLADALQIRLQGVVLWGSQPVPVQFIQILPYALTILVLAGFVGHSRAPRALGLPLKNS